MKNKFKLFDTSGVENGKRFLVRIGPTWYSEGWDARNPQISHWIYKMALFVKQLGFAPRRVLKELQEGMKDFHATHRCNPEYPAPFNNEEFEAELFEKYKRGDVRVYFDPKWNEALFALAPENPVVRVNGMFIPTAISKGIMPPLNAVPLWVRDAVARSLKNRAQKYNLVFEIVDNKIADFDFKDLAINNYIRANKEKLELIMRSKSGLKFDGKIRFAIPGGNGNYAPFKGDVSTLANILIHEIANGAVAKETVDAYDCRKRAYYKLFDEVADEYDFFKTKKYRDWHDTITSGKFEQPVYELRREAQKLTDLDSTIVIDGRGLEKAITEGIAEDIISDLEASGTPLDKYDWAAIVRKLGSIAKDHREQEDDKPSLPMEENIVIGRDGKSRTFYKDPRLDEFTYTKGEIIECDFANQKLQEFVEKHLPDLFRGAEVLYEVNNIRNELKSPDPTDREDVYLPDLVEEENNILLESFGKLLPESLEKADARGEFVWRQIDKETKEKTSEEVISQAVYGALRLFNYAIRVRHIMMDKLKISERFWLESTGYKSPSDYRIAKETILLWKLFPKEKKFSVKEAYEEIFKWPKSRTKVFKNYKYQFKRNPRFDYSRFVVVSDEDPSLDKELLAMFLTTRLGVDKAKEIYDLGLGNLTLWEALLPELGAGGTEIKGISDLLRSQATEADFALFIKTCGNRRTIRPPRANCQWKGRFMLTGATVVASPSLQKVRKALNDYCIDGVPTPNLRSALRALDAAIERGLFDEVSKHFNEEFAFMTKKHKTYYIKAAESIFLGKPLGIEEKDLAAPPRELFLAPEEPFVPGTDRYKEKFLEIAEQLPESDPGPTTFVFLKERLGLDKALEICKALKAIQTEANDPEITPWEAFLPEQDMGGQETAGISELLRTRATEADFDELPCNRQDFLVEREINRLNEQIEKDNKERERLREYLDSIDGKRIIEEMEAYNESLKRRNQVPQNVGGRSEEGRSAPAQYAKFMNIE